MDWSEENPLQPHKIFLFIQLSEKYFKKAKIIFIMRL